jgi:hypothetical protein
MATPDEVTAAHVSYRAETPCSFRDGRAATAPAVSMVLINVLSMVALFHELRIRPASFGIHLRGSREPLPRESAKVVHDRVFIGCQGEGDA